MAYLLTRTSVCIDVFPSCMPSKTALNRAQRRSEGKLHFARQSRIFQLWKGTKRSMQASTFHTFQSKGPMSQLMDECFLVLLFQNMALCEPFIWKWFWLAWKLTYIWNRFQQKATTKIKMNTAFISNIFFLMNTLKILTAIM